MFLNLSSENPGISHVSRHGIISRSDDALASARRLPPSLPRAPSFLPRGLSGGLGAGGVTQAGCPSPTPALPGLVHGHAGDKTGRAGEGRRGGRRRGEWRFTRAVF